jgi:hypothetical protein
MAGDLAAKERIERKERNGAGGAQSAEIRRSAEAWTERGRWSGSVAARCSRRGGADRIAETNAFPLRLGV